MSNVTVARTKSELEMTIERQDQTIVTKTTNLDDDLEPSSRAA